MTPLTFIPPEKPVNAILRLILMNPRWTLAIIVLLAANSAVLAVNHRLDHAALATAKDRIALLETQIELTNGAAQAIADAAKLRAETAEKALEAAREAGKANRQAAVTYLTLPTPVPEQRCEAASELVDAAVAKERQ